MVKFSSSTIRRAYAQVRFKTSELRSYFYINLKELPNHVPQTYCKSTKFDRYKIWRVDYFLSDNRGFSSYNPI